MWTKFKTVNKSHKPMILQQEAQNQQEKKAMK